MKANLFLKQNRDVTYFVFGNLSFEQFNQNIKIGKKTETTGDITWTIVTELIYHWMVNNFGLWKKGLKIQSCE